MRFVLLVFLVGCGATVQEHTEPFYLEPVFDHELPPEPEGVDIEDDLVYPVSSCEIEMEDPIDEGLGLTPPGVYMTKEMALAMARTKVAYDEIRALYKIDLRTMEREREIYQKQLDLAEHETARVIEESRPSWWDKHGTRIMFSVGVLVGASVVIGAAVALDSAVDAVE